METHSPALMLAWRIAAMEAIHLRQSEIAIPHFLLGLMKCADAEFLAGLRKEVADKEPKILMELNKLRTCAGEFVLDITAFRRALRAALPSNPSETEVLLPISRCAVLKELFQSAAEKVVRPSDKPSHAAGASNETPVTTLHLLAEILAAQDPDITAALGRFDIPAAAFQSYIANRVARE
jgi:hypothetical protein